MLMKILFLHLGTYLSLVMGAQPQRENRKLVRPKMEIAGGVEPEPGINNTGAIFSVHTATQSQLSGSGTNGDLGRTQMDTIILLLQRLSDRLASLETLQSQRAERIDTIHFRLTRLELQADERKSVMSELSNNMRHRMETTDHELEQIGTSLDDIKNGITQLSSKQIDIKNLIDNLPKPESDNNSKMGAWSGPRLQAIMASLQGIRSLSSGLKQEVAQVAFNVSSLVNTTSYLSSLNDELVTKQYLLKSLTDLKTSSFSSSSVSYPYMPNIQMRPRQQGSDKPDPEDCWRLKNQGNNNSGVYRIQPRTSVNSFFVYCDMETDGGGWTVIQRREDGSVEFLKEWVDYKHGFGNLAGEFWLGNEKVHHLTNQYVSELRIEIADFDQQEAMAHYNAFAVGSEEEGYSLKMLGKYSGDAGDSLVYHVGQRFSTIDVDNDSWPGKSCARDHEGAWWYRACETSNLNGRYLHGPVPGDHEYKGIYWYEFRGPRYSLWRSRMMIRRGGIVDKPIFKPLNEVKMKATTTTPKLRVRTSTTPSPRTSKNFNPDYDPYATYEYPYDPYG